MVEKAELYPWSSASAYCRLVESDILTKKSRWLLKFLHMPDWSKWLSDELCQNDNETIGRHSQKGLPCRSSQFISKFERLPGRPLGYRHQGRPRKDAI